MALFLPILGVMSRRGPGVESPHVLDPRPPYISPWLPGRRDLSSLVFPTNCPPRCSGTIIYSTPFQSFPNHPHSFNHTYIPSQCGLAC